MFASPPRAGRRMARERFRERDHNAIFKMI
jgi:hypothetical protein